MAFSFNKVMKDVGARATSSHLLSVSSDESNVATAGLGTYRNHTDWAKFFRMVRYSVTICCKYLTTKIGE
jgi:hypothetical protein